MRIGPPSAIEGRLFEQVLLPGGHKRIGPPSAAGTGWTLPAYKAPTSPTVRIATLIASFLVVVTCMVVLLLNLGFCNLAWIAPRKCLC
jgi:hypothetical protein